MFFSFRAVCVWRKIQTTGLASPYGTDEGFSSSLRNLSALAVIPSEEIPQAFDVLKQHLPIEASGIIEWFENNYVHGSVRRHMSNGRVLRSPPLIHQHCGRYTIRSNQKFLVHKIS